MSTSESELKFPADKNSRLHKDSVPKCQCSADFTDFFRLFVALASIRDNFLIVICIGHDKRRSSRVPRSLNFLHIERQQRLTTPKSLFKIRRSAGLGQIFLSGKAV